MVRAYGPRCCCKAETDGDLHIALQDATGDKPGIVVVEVPAKPQWCEIRNTVFSWGVRDSLFTPALVRSWRSIKLPFPLAADWPLSPGEEITAACTDQFTERRVAWTVPVS